MKFRNFLKRNGIRILTPDEFYPDRVDLHMITEIAETYSWAETILFVGAMIITSTLNMAAYYLTLIPMLVNVWCEENAGY